MKDLLPFGSINVKNNPKEFMNQMADLAEEKFNFSVERLLDINDRFLEIDFVKFFRSFRSYMKGFSGR